MQAFWEEMIIKIKALPQDERLKVIDGLAKMLAEQPKGHSDDLLDSISKSSVSSMEHDRRE